MVNGLFRLARACALCLVCAGCGSDDAADPSPTASAGRSGAGSWGGSATSAAGDSSSGASGGTSSASDGAPLPVAGKSIYALECHGESKDCHGATVPCFGVGSETPNVAAGWACSNRCASDADCSDAPSGAEAKASCVPFSAASHCVLICRNEHASSSCPDGMTCYTAPKSPIGYCLWP